MIAHVRETASDAERPIGRIDYLGADGKIGESIQYTSAAQFVKDIKEQNFYGVPMVIVLYKGQDGKTIPQDFLSSLDPPPRGIHIVTPPEPVRGSGGKEYCPER